MGRRGRRHHGGAEGVRSRLGASRWVPRSVPHGVRRLRVLPTRSCSHRVITARRWFHLGIRLGINKHGNRLFRGRGDSPWMSSCQGDVWCKGCELHPRCSVPAGHGTPHLPGHPELSKKSPRNNSKEPGGAIPPASSTPPPEPRNGDEWKGAAAWPH